MADIATIAEIGTAVGTLFLGAATFGSTRSANRAARVAERSLLLGMRPVLTPARAGDPNLKIMFGEGRKFVVPAGTGLVEEIDGVVYLAIPLRNVGTGLAVLQRYDISTGYQLQDVHGPLAPNLKRSSNKYGPLESFRAQQIDIYIAPGDTGHWQAALRDPDDSLLAEVRQMLAGEPEPIAIDVLYGDHEGGQHLISRFVLIPHSSGKWLCNVTFHWVLDGDDPRDLDDD
jgi:hypothetical protein